MNGDNASGRRDGESEDGGIDIVSEGHLAISIFVIELPSLWVVAVDAERGIEVEPQFDVIHGLYGEGIVARGGIVHRFVDVVIGGMDGEVNRLIVP